MQVLEAAARFHHRLVFIHVFPNGNGRHARIAADVYLKQYFEASPIQWNDVEELKLSNLRTDEYIKALRAADNHDFGLLFDFVGL